MQKNNVLLVHICIFSSQITKTRCMKRLLTIALGLLSFLLVNAQLLTVAPAFPKDNDNITITMDAGKGNLGLNNYANTNDVYVHTGVITNLSANGGDWRYVRSFGVASNLVFTTPIPQLKAASAGSNKYTYSITDIRSFYGVPAGETILKISILFRSGNGSVVQRNTDGGDMYIPVYDNTVVVKFTTPPFQPKFISEPEPITKSIGDNIALTAISNKPATLNLYLNGTLIQTAAAATTISANPAITAGGNTTIIAEAIDGAMVKKDSVKFFVAGGVTVAPLPAGVRDGINYNTNNTEATLAVACSG